MERMCKSEVERDKMMKYIKVYLISLLSALLGGVSY